MKTTDAHPAGMSAAVPDSAAPRYGWYALGVMFVVYLLSFVDRQIISILAEDIKRDLALDDAQLGFLYGTAFAIFYAVLGIPLGKLADSWLRGRLMAIGLALWSAMTVLSGFSQSYAMLALARIGVGIGEASASPAAYSMLADYFPPEKRALANSIYSAGLYVGMGLSLPLGGAVSQGWDRYFGADAPLGLSGWQAAFVVVGLPGLLVAAWVFSLREPARLDTAGRRLPAVSPTVWRDFFGELAAVLPPFTLASASRYPGGLRRNLLGLAGVAVAMAGLVHLTGDPVQWTIYGIGFYAVLSWVQILRFRDPAAYALIWGSRPMVVAIGSFGCLAIMTYGYSFWVAPFAVRTFGLSVSEVGLAIGIPGAAAAAIGVVAGGRLSDIWKTRDPRGRIHTCMIAAVVPLFVIPVMFNTNDFLAYSLISPVAYFFINMWVGSTVAAYQDMVISRMFGLISATYLIGSTMVGLAIGPYASGKVATVTDSLQAGVFSLLPFSVLAGAGLLYLSRHIEALERTKEDRARAALDRAA
jgi:MFS family permease